MGSNKRLYEQEKLRGLSEIDRLKHISQKEKSLKNTLSKLNYKFIFPTKCIKIPERMVHPKFRWNISRGYSFKYFGEYFTIDEITSVAEKNDKPLIINVYLRYTLRGDDLPY